MAFETRTSGRLIPTARAHRQVSSGNSKTRRISVDGTWSTITFAPKIVSVTMRNDGANDIKIRINNTGANFLTLKPDAVIEKISINNSTLEVSTVSGSSNLECIFEG